MKPKILIVDDDPTHCRMLETVLGAEGYETDRAHDGRQALEKIEAGFFDLILIDIRMAHVDGIEALERIKQFNPEVPVIMMTAYSSISTAVRAMKAGAYDYLTKPLDIDELKMLVTKALRHHHLEKENVFLKEQLGSRFEAANMIGRSAAMNRVLETVAMVAPTEATVLIQGESGTGKELIANAIHQNSPRKNRPLVKVNCAALPETLLESELFGHEKGAFTGASGARKGRFQMAHQGTIFLDEIGEMPMSTQSKILRVLQEREFEPIGSSKSIQVDTRVVTATNKNLAEEIKANRIREDLYYRINVVSITAPALRDRKEDIPLLAEHFLKRYAEKNRRSIKGFSPKAMDLLMRYHWPGNVRELENVIERAVILTRGQSIMLDAFPNTIRDANDGDTHSEDEQDSGKSLKAMEKKMILSTLEQTGGNRTHCARILGISRRTLQLKLKEYGVN
jgi:two-component system, NtrC family, response regulator HydG